VGIGGLLLANVIPTQRGALVAPLLAAVFLAGAGIWLARARTA
jgi:hypothetical protein